MIDKSFSVHWVLINIGVKKTRVYRNQGVTKRCRLHIFALVYEPKCGGKGGVAESQLYTGVQIKLWISNFIFMGGMNVPKCDYSVGVRLYNSLICVLHTNTSGRDILPLRYFSGWICQKLAVEQPLPGHGVRIPDRQGRSGTYRPSQYKSLLPGRSLAAYPGDPSCLCRRPFSWESAETVFLIKIWLKT